MLSVSSQQWNTLEEIQEEYFKSRLTGYLHGVLREADDSDPITSAHMISKAAIALGKQMAADTEYQIAQLALIILAVSRAALTSEEILKAKSSLFQTSKTLEQRMHEAAQIVGVHV